MENEFNSLPAKRNFSFSLALFASRNNAANWRSLKKKKTAILDDEKRCADVFTWADWLSVAFNAAEIAIISKQPNHQLVHISFAFHFRPFSSMLAITFAHTHAFLVGNEGWSDALMENDARFPFDFNSAKRRSKLRFGCADLALIYGVLGR